LSAGAAIAIGLAMMRALTGFNIMYILVPGYATALILMIFCPKLFTGIAFDSGGVASGPISSTFVLSFALGASQAAGGSFDAFGVIALAMIVFVIHIETGFRRVPVTYAKRVVGGRMGAGHSSHIPFKVNQAGVIPIIFASSILIFPYTIANFFSDSAVGAFIRDLFAAGRIFSFYTLCYVVLVVFFSYFYTAVVFNPTDIASNMKKYGGFILGIRPGQPTSDYISRVMERITMAGGIFLAIVAIIPNVMTSIVGTRSFYFGGTAVLIVVGVALDTINQIEAQLLMRHYDGILKKSGGKAGSLLRM